MGRGELVRRSKRRLLDQMESCVGATNLTLIRSGAKRWGAGKHGVRQKQFTFTFSRFDVSVECSGVPWPKDSVVDGQNTFPIRSQRHGILVLISDDW